MPAPNVIFATLQNAGASAIDPILRELLERKGYFVSPRGPEETEQFVKELSGAEIREPYYYWTHHSAATFSGQIGSEDCRFVYMHRDPRDVAVSIAFDYQKRGFAADRTFDEILEMIALAMSRMQVMEAIDWVNTGCLVITFEQMKADTPSVIKTILDYIGYPEVDERLAGRPASTAEIEATIDRHSFERVTGRKRGSDGEVIRSNYMHRKGVSGEWKKHFSAELTRKYHLLNGAALRKLGYTLDPDAS